MRRLFHTLAWIALWLLALFLLPAGVAKDTIGGCIMYEEAMISDYFGEDDWGKLFNKAIEVYQSTPTIPRRSNIADKPPLKHDASHKYVDELDDYSDRDDVTIFRQMLQGVKRAADKIADNWAVYWDTLQLTIFHLILRVMILGTIIVYILPFVAAMIFDGAMQHNIYVVSFVHTNPIKYDLAWHTVIGLTFIPAIYLLAPFPLTPLVLIGWAVIYGIALRQVMAYRPPLGAAMGK